MAWKRKQAISVQPKTMRTRVVGICSVLLIIFVLSVVGTRYVHDKETAVTLERYVEGKLTLANVSDHFTPVLLYKYENGTAYSVGSGTMFVGRSGERRVITAEHIFWKGFGTRTYLVRVLRPFSDDITFGLSRIIATGKEMTGSDRVDIAEAAVGDPKPIVCFSRFGSEHDTGPEAMKSKFVKIGPGGLRLRSVVSGERVESEAHSDPLGAGSYILIRYASIAGESGTGFVDATGRLYVLKAAIATVPELGLTDCSMVYGPLNFAK